MGDGPRHVPPGLPARRIDVPAGVVLTDDEIVQVLGIANARKATGDPGFDLATVLDGEYYTLKIPKTVAIDREEVIAALTRLNHAAEYGEAEILFVFHKGRMVKKGWITLREEGPGNGIQAGGTPVPKAF